VLRLRFGRGASRICYSRVTDGGRRRTPHRCAPRDRALGLPRGDHGAHRRRGRRLAHDAAPPRGDPRRAAALAEADHNAIFHDEGPRGLSRPGFTEPIRRLLEDGAADGSLVAPDPDEGATLLLNLVGWTYRHLRRGHGWSAERARDGVLRIALDGVAAR
jgi:hypothetical protein